MSAVPESRPKVFEYHEPLRWFWIDHRHIPEGLEASEQAGLDGAVIDELSDWGTVRQVDLTPLRDRHWIRRLRLDFVRAKAPVDVVGADALATLPNLQELSVDNYDPDLTKLNHLTHLYLRYPKKQRLALGPSPYKHITVTHHRDADLRCFAGCETLESLAVQRSSLRTLDGLDGLPSLRSLVISHSPKLEDISALARATRLEKVHFEANKHVRDFSVFEGHPALKDFFASDLESVAFVPSVPHLEKVRFWNCKDGDLRPLLQSKSLKCVFFSKDCKHYTHKEREIQALLADGVSD